MHLLVISEPLLPLAVYTLETQFGENSTAEAVCF